MSTWTSLPRQWQLEDVQAGLNVLITGLSTLVIFVCARFCWEAGARRVAGDSAVPLSSLVTLNTPGEALDAFVLLRHKMSTHLGVLAQCVVVLAFSVTTLVSGPIARYATQITDIEVEEAVHGLLSGRQHNSLSDAQVDWNLTETSLNRAGFPLDQLLDYLPDTSHNWKYHKAEWNNSWALACSEVEQTAVSIVLTNNCSSLEDKMLGIDTVVPAWFYSVEQWWDATGFYESREISRDDLITMYSSNYTTYDEDLDIFRKLSISFAALHIHRTPRNTSSEGGYLCDWAEGSPESAYFNRIDCEITYNGAVGDETFHIALPDTGDEDAIPSALAQYYSSRFKKESIAAAPITPITPRDLQRFYQTYMITKDTQDVQPVIRTLSVTVPVVQVSTVFLAIFCFISLLVVLGGIKYAFFLLRHRNILPYLPQGKLDWMIQSITGLLPSNFDTDPNQPNWKITVGQPRGALVDWPQSKRELFETTVFGPCYCHPIQQTVYPDKFSPMSPASSQMSPHVTPPSPDTYMYMQQTSDACMYTQSASTDSHLRPYKQPSAGPRMSPVSGISTTASPTLSPPVPPAVAYRSGSDETWFSGVQRYPSLRQKSP